MSPKSRLQEITQATYKNLPNYVVASASGPEHKRVYHRCNN